MKGIFFLFSICIFSCVLSCKKKKKETTIEGSVTSKVENIPVSNVAVGLYKREVSNGSFSNSFKKIDEQVFSGKYSFNFVKEGGDIEYKLLLSSAGYINKEKVFSADDVVSGESNTFDIELLPVGKVNLHIKSGVNSTVDDAFSFSLNGECAYCCLYADYAFQGNNIDTIISCHTVAEKYVKYSYFLTRNNTTDYLVDSFFCEKGNEINVSLIY